MQTVSGKKLREQARQYVTCPDTGNTYLMRRPMMADFVKVGGLPENFIAQTVVSVGRDASSGGELTDKDLVDAETLQRVLLTASMMMPRIVENALEDDEVEYRDIPQSDRNYLFAWCNSSLPETKIQTEGGEVTVGDLETFPARQRAEKPASAGDNSEAQGNECEPGARAA